MGHRGSPCPGGVRLTAWASAASTDCSASPRRSRPLRALGERGRAAGSAHLSSPALYPRLCLLRSPPARPQVEPLLKTGTTFGAGRDPRHRMAPRTGGEAEAGQEVTTNGISWGQVAWNQSSACPTGAHECDGQGPVPTKGPALSQGPRAPGLTSPCL